MSITFTHKIPHIFCRLYIDFLFFFETYILMLTKRKKKKKRDQRIVGWKILMKKERQGKVQNYWVENESSNQWLGVMNKHIINIWKVNNSNHMYHRETFYIIPYHSTVLWWVPNTQSEIVTSLSGANRLDYFLSCNCKASSLSSLISQYVLLRSRSDSNFKVYIQLYKQFLSFELVRTVYFTYKATCITINEKNETMCGQ